MSLIKFGSRFLTFGSKIISYIAKVKPDIPTNYVLYKASDIVGSYSSTTGPAFFFKPAEDFSADCITVYCGRKYLASRSNINGDIDMTFIEEYDADMNHTKTLLSYQTASVYGAIDSTTTTYQWFSDPNGGGRSDNGSNATSSGEGIHKVYGINPIVVDGCTLYEYKIKATNGGKLEFSSNCFYRLGFAAGFHCSSVEELYTLGIDYAADANNNLVAHSNTSTGLGTHYATSDCHLPYFKYGTEDNQVVFTDFDLVNPGPSPEPTIEFTNGDWNVTSYNTIDDIKSSLNDGDKLALFVRHAERGSATGKAGGLTDNGVNQAKNLGTALQSVSVAGDFYGEATDVLRTLQSVYWISSVRGDGDNLEPWYDTDTDVINTNITKSDVYKGTAYTTINDWNSLSEYCSNPDNKSHITEVSQTILCHIVDLSTKTLNMFCSHDTVLVPMISYITNWQLVPTANSWCNYLNGVAIIMRSTGTIEIAPLNALID